MAKPIAKSRAPKTPRGRPSLKSRAAEAEALFRAVEEMLSTETSAINEIADHLFKMIRSTKDKLSMVRVALQLLKPYADSSILTRQEKRQLLSTLRNLAQ